ncbi:MAG: ATP phosphoribosyltransferase regulatory subunit [Brevinematales bacterium]|nr:ATP phosphoribosyltransferase regulatory subunit [Brevinematales bacterium]
MNSYLEYMLYESDVEPFGLPDGVIFLSSDEILKLEEKEKMLTKIFESKGYKKVIPPSFEYYETFENAGGKEVARRCFSFKDKDGKLLSLRFDMTTPIARMIAHKNLIEGALKYYYCGDVFREQPFHKGKMRQLRQCGIELIGVDSIEADIEVVEMFAQSLECFSSEHTIVLGNVKPYKKLIEKLNLTESKKEAIENIFNKKDLPSLKLILEQIEGNEKIKKNLIELINLSGEINELVDKVSNFNEDLKEEILKFLDFCKKLSKSIREKVIIDFAMIKNFSYYSSLTMEGYLKNYGQPIANGGRYDELFKRFDKNLPAIGFAVDINL